MSAPVDHPQPWRWFDHALLDANNESVGVVWQPYGFEPTSLVAEQLRAAPEMERMLRRIEEDYSNICPTCNRKRTFGHEPTCEFAALLARLDEARKAGG